MHTNRSLLIITALVTVVVSKGYCCCPDRVALAKSSTQYRSKYVNGDYRFSVNIPKGVIGFGSVASEPNHGFVAFVPGHWQSCLYVEVFYINPDDSLKHHQFVDDHKVPVGQLMLDQLKTANTITKSMESCGGLQTPRTLETVTAIANEGVSGGFPVDETEYRIVLDATGADYEAAHALLKHLMMSFRRLGKPTTQHQ